MWVCVCDCGTEKEVAGTSLTRGVTRSCGCLHKELLVERSTSHGRSDTPEFRVWAQAIQRCENPRDKAFPYYGARGIMMCDRWRQSFEAFITDMGRRPSAKHTIDRIDNDGPYAPENCRWAEMIVQNGNRSITRLHEMNGRSMKLKAWAEELNIPLHQLRYQIERLHVSLADAVKELRDPNHRTGPKTKAAA